MKSQTNWNNSYIDVLYNEKPWSKTDSTIILD